MTMIILATATTTVMTRKHEKSDIEFNAERSACEPKIDSRGEITLQRKLSYSKFASFVIVFQLVL